MSDKISVFGIGNPLMDFVVNVDEDLIKTLGTEKGTMSLMDAEKKEKLKSSISLYKNIPGGSCANTLRGIAWLSKHDPIDKTVYSGAVGKDDVGDKYISMMGEEYGILPIIPRKEKATGICIAFVTPDYERTMFTYLGACEEFSENDVDLETLKNAKILHFTGYMWSTENEKKAVMKASQFCKDQGVKISFDLADPVMVKFQKKNFLDWIPRYVDILFGNAEEISKITDKKGSDSEIAQAAGNLSKVVIMKTGAKGCLVNDNGNIIPVKGLKVDAIDTVGAGDAFASGFLYGYTKGMDLETCAKIANRIAAGIVTVEGCDFSKLRQEDVLG